MATSAPRGVLPWVAVGGAVGALLRYAVLRGLPPGAEGFPVATLLANVVGAALLGALVAVPVARLALSSAWRAGLGAGFCGGLTTFSTLAVEVAARLGPAPATALVYAGVSLLLLPVAVLGGGLLATRVLR